MSTGFESVLRVPGHPVPDAWSDDLPLYRDVNLDQVVEAVIAGREAYELREFFYAPLDDLADIEYRQDVFRDLDGTAARTHVEAFAETMRSVRRYRQLTRKHGYEYQQKRWFLAAASDYCRAVDGLAEALRDAELHSAGVTGLRDHLARYRESAAFARLRDDVAAVETALAGIRYCVEIRGDRVRVGYFHDEPDYSEEVAAVFEKFRQGAVRSYLVKFADYEDMDHVEAQILLGVAQLFPEQFGALDRFSAEHADFADRVVLDFDREVQFYLSYLDYVAPLRKAGLALAYPALSVESKAERAEDTFDLALAVKLVASANRVITNDYHLDGAERMIVISGPNQGGKTTLARTFGQLHYLAKLGVLVPGREVALVLCDRVYTHFERPENLRDLIGKLQDDLVRIHAILAEATPRSVVILNEIFTSTTMQDALVLSKEILSRLIALDVLCVCVSFLEELSRLGPATVSMVSTVRPEDPASRTFKVVRQVADGRAYAMAIAERYGLTYEQLKKRVAEEAGGDAA